MMRVVVVKKPHLIAGLFLVLLVLVGSEARAAPASPPLPVVLWHGMGDTCCWSFSMGAVKARIESVLPGVYVHSIRIGSTLAADERAGFFGNCNAQVEGVCAQLEAAPQLAAGFNAVGFSQGGQFLRAVLERCQHTGPKMFRLITLGGQHQGIMSPPHCLNPSFNATQTALCKEVSALLAKGAYAPVVRNEVVQAQYFKDPYDLSAYQEFNPFLPDINNEGAVTSAVYKKNVASLDRLVLVQFEKDSMVVPRESSWFGFYDAKRGLLAMNETRLYQEDLIGLRTLDLGGRIELLTVPGADHMQFGLDWFENSIIVPHLGY